MRHLEIKNLVFASILAALTIILSLPYLVIPVNKVAFTLAHIPVLLGVVSLGKKYGVILGGVMGVTSMVLAFITLGDNAPFTNPLLSVLPRMLFGLVTFYLYQGFTKLFKKKEIAIPFTFAAGTLFHSIIVLTLLYIVSTTGFYFTASENPMTTNSNLIIFVVGIISAISVFEILAAVLVGTPTALVLLKLMDNTHKE